MPNLEDAASGILLSNLRRGRASWVDRDFTFVCPSQGTYPFQWFWDSCFHAITLLHLDPELAKAELLTLLSAAHPSGRIPHLIFWEAGERDAFLEENVVRRATPHTSASIQPPVLAQAVERVFRATGDEGFLARCLPPLEAFYGWLKQHRDPDDDGLIAIVQPEESGMDCSPRYDRVLGLERPDHDSFLRALRRLMARYEALGDDDAALLAADLFQVEDVAMNAIYAQGLRSLARLLDGRGDAEGWHAEADRVRESLVSRCWDPDRGLFCDLAGAGEEPIRVCTIGTLMPLVLEDLPREIVCRLVDDLVSSPEHFWLPYPLPSVSLAEPTFDGGDLGGWIWRGGTWISTNWFLVHALRQHGFPDLADDLAARSRKLVERSGFREYYDPHTGAGYGAEDFAWSTLVLDM